MIKSITDFLELHGKDRPDKCVYADKDRSVTYGEFVEHCKKAACGLPEKKNVAIFIDKTVNCLTAMFAAAYANACYTIIDVQSPVDRVHTILSTIHPDCVLTDRKNVNNAERFGFQNLILLEDLLKNGINYDKLAAIQKRRIDTDPLYILFTSCSTGIPKGTVVAHRSVIDYAQVVCESFAIDKNTIWGSQTPFYFSMSVLDVFATVVAGGTLQIIPKLYFSFPYMLIDYINERHINAIYWVPTALSIVANFETFEKKKPQYLKKILFAGETMPVKQLNYWIRHLPDVMYANLYGPTEITDTCTYYIVNRPFKDSDSLPIGNEFDNCEVLVINEDNRRVLSHEDGMGELYVRGSFLGMGYYGNVSKTSEAFVQNPLNKEYPELLYRTGDLVCYNEYNELVFRGRKDSQIKHMGHRIELGEIESVASAVAGIDRVCCLYDSDKTQIVLFYSGTVEEEHVAACMRCGVPNYMVPQRILKKTALPINMNGKIDRIKLKEELA